MVLELINENFAGSSVFVFSSKGFDAVLGIVGP